jgi:hypothetical protein
VKYRPHVNEHIPINELFILFGCDLTSIFAHCGKIPWSQVQESTIVGYSRGKRFVGMVGREMKEVRLCDRKLLGNSIVTCDCGLAPEIESINQQLRECLTINALN